MSVPAGVRALADAATAVVRVRDWWVVGVNPVGTITGLDELSAFADLIDWKAEGPRRAEEAPPFAGGAIGYLSDDLSPALLALPAEDRRPAVSGLEPLRFGVYDTAICVGPDGAAQVVAVDLPGWSSSPAAERAAVWEEHLGTAGVRDGWSPHAEPVPVTPSLDEPAHTGAVQAILASIAAGDMYQVNLTMQLAVPWAHGGWGLAERLWAASPGAAHAAWLRTPQAEVVSVSPETFVRTDGARVVSRPIKGTRSRGADPTKDRANADDLVTSTKDRAEHVMIVDLVRNDLGRVCVTGSVRVLDLAALEELPTVWHLTSTVQGEMSPSTSFGDLIGALFPPGSVTGAPKRAAWSRIRELEPVRRGVYCGAVGVITRGLADFSVAIRTAVVAEGVASYGAGGGIVADSEPAAEHAEALDKAAAFFTAVGSPGVPAQ